MALRVASSTTNVSPDGPWAFGWEAIGALGTALAAIAALAIWIGEGQTRMRTRARAVGSEVLPSEHDVNAVIANYSDLPLYDVVIESAHLEGVPKRIPIIHPGDRHQFTPGDDVLIRSPHWHDARLRLVFTIDGRRWRLDERGRLRRAREPRIVHH